MHVILNRLHEYYAVARTTIIIVVVVVISITVMCM